jgi:hypothetical protein
MKCGDPKQSVCCLIVSTALAACADVLPPPVVLLHEAVTQSAPGGVSIAVVGGVAYGSELGFGRVGVRYQAPQHNWLSLRVGLGGNSYDLQRINATADLGVSVGWTIAHRLRPYLGTMLGFSSAMGSWGRETLWVGGTLGVSVCIVNSLELGIESMVMGGFRLDGASTGDTAVLSITGSVRYTFGAMQ